MDAASHEFDPDRVRALEAFGKVPSATLAAHAAPVAFGRDRELEQLERHLTGSNNNSFMLVGPSGCGKSAILRELFRRLARRPEDPWLVLETSAGYLLAGCSVIGTLERKLRDLVHNCNRNQRVAVFFTDIFAAPDAGKTSKDDMNIADFLTPFAENGELVLIGECTPEQFRRGIEPNPTFRKLFTVFQLRPLEDRQVKQVVAAVADQTVERFAAQGVNLRFTVESLAALQEYGRLYYPGVSPPGGALRLMDHMVSHRFSETARASADAPRGESTEYSLGHQDVIQALESFTGIPGLLLDDTRRLELGALRQFFDSRVLGQAEAIGTVTDVITLVKAGVTDPSKPMSVLFFVGPTGVGKTELAKALAEYIFGSPDRMIRFDMSEFKDYHSFEKLIGSNDPRHSFVHSGSLLSRVKQQPFSLILLDEIEKAHNNIFDVLLQLFDDGRLSDAQGNTTDFTQTLVVMTSNLGSNLADERSGFGFSADEPDDLESRIRVEISEFFRPEFVNRIDRVVVFQPLKHEHMRTLAQRELGQVLLRHGITRRKLRVDVDPGVIDVLLQEGFSPMYGARPLKRAVERLALIPIARQIVKLGPEGHGALLRLISSKNRIQVKIVQDRRARSADVVTQGVKIVDPVSSRRVKLKRSDLDERMERLHEVVQSLERLCNESMLRERKALLMNQTSRVDFWDHPDQARAVLGEIYRSERLLDATSRVFDRSRKLHDALARDNHRAEDLSRLAHQIHEMQQHAELLRYSMECQGELEQCDAFVILSALDEPRDDDLVGKLADMYRQWAEQKGFEVAVLHEELFNPKITREIALLIEGVAVYGILQGEEGIHEFLYNRTSQNPRISQLAKVRVLPAIDDEVIKFTASELEINKKKSQGKGLRCKLYRSQVTVTHLPSHVSITGRNDLAASRSAELLTDWLRAEIHAVRYLESELSNGDHESIRRKYTLRPQQNVKDQRTGVATRNLGELWQGRGLDEFLYATILQRNGRDLAQAPSEALHE